MNNKTLELAAAALSSAADDLMKTDDLTPIRLGPTDRSVSFDTVIDEIQDSLDGRYGCRPLILGLFVKYLSRCVRDAALAAGRKTP